MSKLRQKQRCTSSGQQLHTCQVWIPSDRQFLCYLRDRQAYRDSLHLKKNQINTIYIYDNTIHCDIVYSSIALLMFICKYLDKPYIDILLIMCLKHSVSLWSDTGEKSRSFNRRKGQYTGWQTEEASKMIITRLVHTQGKRWNTVPGKRRRKSGT